MAPSKKRKDRMDERKEQGREERDGEHRGQR